MVQLHCSIIFIARPRQMLDEGTRVLSKVNKIIFIEIRPMKLAATVSFDRKKILNLQESNSK